jgi:predicted nucleic acid-binding protein
VRRVRLDSNVYTSALNFGGKPLRVLEFARAGQIENAISNAIITETSRMLYTKSRREGASVGLPEQRPSVVAVLVEQRRCQTLTRT